VREYVFGLVAGLERNNGWTLAEHASEVSRGLSNNGTASGDSELKIAGFTTTGRRADRSRSRF